MAYKMKAGKEGPMRKNFPGAFKHRVPKGWEHEAHADDDTYTEITTGHRGDTLSTSDVDFDEGSLQMADVRRARSQVSGFDT